MAAVVQENSAAQRLGSYYEALIEAGVPEATAHEIVLDAARRMHGALDWELV